MRRVSTSFSFCRSAIASLLIGSLPLASQADYYVSSGPLTGGGAIYRFADDGTPKGTFGALEQPVGMLWLPNDVLLVCDYQQQKARLLHADGTDLGVFADAVDCISPLIDSYGNVLIAEYTSGQILRFGQDGSPLGVFASPGTSRQDQLAMDTAGNIYTCSLFPGEQLIYRYDRDGNFLGVFADFNTAGLQSPTGMGFQSDGSMIVTNTIYDTIDKLDASGNLIGQFANTGMSEAMWVTVEPDDGVLVPSWTGGWVERYAADGTDLGVFVNVPNGYHILRGPDIVVPDDMQVFRGRVDLGDPSSLAEDDGDVLRLCRFFVVNAVDPPIQVEVRGSTAMAEPSGLSVAVTSRMVANGAFSQQLIMIDENGVQSPTVRRTDALATVKKHVRLVATGNPADFVAADGRLRLRINIRQTGPTTTLNWCSEFDRVVWTVRR